MAQELVKVQRELNSLGKVSAETSELRKKLEGSLAAIKKVETERDKIKAASAQNLLVFKKTSERVQKLQQDLNSANQKLAKAPTEIKPTVDTVKVQALEDELKQLVAAMELLKDDKVFREANTQSHPGKLTSMLINCLMRAKALLVRILDASTKEAPQPEKPDEVVELGVKRKRTE